MMRIRRAAAALLSAIFVSGCDYARPTQVTILNFELGKNIADTARASGAPSFDIQKVAGANIYSVVELAPSVVAQYAVPGYEVRISPVFSVSMYADVENKDNLAVESVSLLVPRHATKSHAEARKFVESIVSQFNKGKWVRYIADYCPAVTGRSVYLAETGEINTENQCALDPIYSPSDSDWIALMSNGQRYQWVGDGVLATLSVVDATSNGAFAYKIDLQFDNKAIADRRHQERTAEDLREGDAAGRRSTEKYKLRQKERDEAILRQEEKALERGDKVVPRS
jgi:hypothetical protein